MFWLGRCQTPEIVTPRDCRQQGYSPYGETSRNNQPQDYDLKHMDQCFPFLHLGSLNEFLKANRGGRGVAQHHQQGHQQVSLGKD